jgi:hypothetical protein
VQNLTTGPGSFSFDGKTLLQKYNDVTLASGDIGDWAASNQGGPTGDSYGAAYKGTPGYVTQVDLDEMNVIGWQIQPTVAQVETLYNDNPTAMALSVRDSAANVSQGFGAMFSLMNNYDTVPGSAGGAFSSITFTDSSPILSITEADFADGALKFEDGVSMFSLIKGNYALSVALSSGDTPQFTSLPNNVSKITFTGSGAANVGGNSSNDVFDVEAQGNQFIDAGGTGNYTIEGNAGTTTLSYAEVTGNLTIDIANGTVTKPGANNTTATDHFSGGVQTFDGGSGANLFEGIGTGKYAFNGSGTNNTLSYSADQDAVTIDVAAGTVTKDAATIKNPLTGLVLKTHYLDSFSDIQSFVGSGNGGTTFKSALTGDYDFNGIGSGNTLDYSGDAQGVTVTLVDNNGTVNKGLVYDGSSRFPWVYESDTFNNIQSFVGSDAGNNTFQGVGNYDYSFTGEGTNNTLDYSLDTSKVTIDLTKDTVEKETYSTGVIGISSQYADSFSDIQNFVGNGHDTLIFGGASSQYTFGSDTSGMTITGPIGGQNSTIHVDNIGTLQFTDKTMTG